MHRVLLIDDEEAILDVFQILLTDRNYVVDCARDMKEVREHLDQNHYLAVVADLSLIQREMNERQVLERLARQPVKPLMVVSSVYLTNDAKESALAMDADMFLAKPFAFRTFLEKFDNLLNSIRAHKTIRATGRTGLTMGISP
jgi:DNA-binding response OmpR family regulator